MSPAAPTLITPHFALEEFGRQQRIRANKVFVAAAYPKEWIQPRLTHLCEALEVIRTALGDRVIHVGSGYRDRAYNQAIGGARHSQHMEGRAADITVDGVPPEEVHRIVLDLIHASGLRVQGVGRYPSFTHVDIRPGRLVTWTGSRPAPEGEDG